MMCTEEKEFGHLFRCTLRWDVPPSTGIWWSRAVLYQTIMTLASSLGDDDIKFYPPVLASGGQEQYYIRSSWHWLHLWVMMGLLYPLVLASGGHWLHLWVMMTLSFTPPPTWMQIHLPVTGNITFFNIQQLLPSPLSQIRQPPTTNTITPCYWHK